MMLKKVFLFHFLLCVCLLGFTEDMILLSNGEGILNMNNIAIEAFFDISQFKIKKKKLILTSPSSMLNGYTIFVENKIFTVGVDDNFIIKHISTNDITFYTPEGYHVGMTFEEVVLNKNFDVKKVYGWGYTIELPSKWILVFEIKDSSNDYPEKNDSILWMYLNQNF